MARTRSDFKACKFCGAVGKFAWTAVSGRWALADAKLDADGNVVREVREVMLKGRKTSVLSAVADTPLRLHRDVCTASEDTKRAVRAARAAKRSGLSPVPVDPVAEKIRKNDARIAALEAADQAAFDATEKRIRADFRKEHGIAAPASIPTGSPLAASVAIVGTMPLSSAKPAVKVAKLPSAVSLTDPAVLSAWERYKLLLGFDRLPMRVLAWGPPGTGKTETPWRVSQANGWQHVYQLMTEETPAVELLGHLVIQGGDTVWSDGSLGRAIRASQTGHVVYTIDEIGRASADAQSACLLALTNPESLRLTLRTGETLAPVPEHWHVVATSNDAPNTLNPAVADRLHLSIHLDGPSPDLVETMTTALCRRLATSRAREYSVRALLTFDRLMALGITLDDAARMIWEPAPAQAVIDAARLEA